MRQFLLALALDLVLGEPSNTWHPVAWFGKFVQALERRAPRDDPRGELLYGAGIVGSGIAIAVLPALALERLTRARKRAGWSILISAMALKATFAWRALIQAGLRVQHDLESTQAESARADLTALVSRDTAQLDTPKLAAAAVESLAENASDSFVAPLLYYHFFGLPGAYVYRAVNTLDAMIGYHGRYEFLGKCAARLDDVLNWLPARLTGAWLVLAALLAGGDGRRAWDTMWRDHANTASPNAGYPMSAMAGTLDVRLEKVGHYCLNQDGRAVQPQDIRRAAKVVSVALGLAVLAGILVTRSDPESKA